MYEKSGSPLKNAFLGNVVYAVNEYVQRSTKLSKQGNQARPKL